MLAAEHNVDIYSVTFDGTNVNFTMCEHLGANFKVTQADFEPFFIHPLTLDTIFCYPDPSHMLKNARNAFSGTSYDETQCREKPFVDEDGGKISWKYLVWLNRYQNECGIVFAKANSFSHNVELG